MLLLVKETLETLTRIQTASWVGCLVTHKKFFKQLTNKRKYVDYKDEDDDDDDRHCRHHQPPPLKKILMFENVIMGLN